MPITADMTTTDGKVALTSRELVLRALDRALAVTPQDPPTPPDATDERPRSERLLDGMKAEVSRLVEAAQADHARLASLPAGLRCARENIGKAERHHRELLEAFDAAGLEQAAEAEARTLVHRWDHGPAVQHALMMNLAMMRANAAMSPVVLEESERVVARARGEFSAFLIENREDLEKLELLNDEERELIRKATGATGKKKGTT